MLEIEDGYVMCGRFHVWSVQLVTNTCISMLSVSCSMIYFWRKAGEPEKVPLDRLPRTGDPRHQLP